MPEVATNTRVDDRLLFRDHEAAERLGISRAHLRKQIAAGHVRIVKIGNATRITRQELNRFVESLGAN
jgi:excisionase family DNA binding protein